MSTETDEDDDRETPEERHSRLANLFEWWDAFSEATTPVAQASALLEFSNILFHFRSNVEREWARDARATDEP